ncbi:MAG: hypothetical protein IPM82_16455 [Saprospiraceae bacterium]|nr:hypothetical protein [Saprospiraceae bacterium]
MPKASSPKYCETGSPGASLLNPNDSKLTNTRVGMNSKVRLRRYWNMVVLLDC